MTKPTSRAVTKGLSSFLLCAALLVPVIAESAPINTDEADLVIKGYDVVAYFTEGRAVKGKSEFEYSWQNVRWRFSTAANRDLFAANSERYAPQYGGFCAYCLIEAHWVHSDGSGMPAASNVVSLQDSNPKAWTIADGKLYLHRSMYQRTQWREGKVSYIKQADDAWAKLTGEKVEVPRPKDDKTSPAIKIAIFPFYNASWKSLWTQSDFLGEFAAKVIRRNRSLDLVYSYYSADDSVDQIVDADKIWRGGVYRKQVNEELIYELGAELGVDAVLLLQWRADSRSPSATADDWDAEIYVLDIGQRRLYHEPESQFATGKIRESDLEKATSPVFSRFLEGRNKVSQAQ